MKLWLDDVRSCPEGWELALSVNSAIKLILEAGDGFEFASLDHDLGDYSSDGGDGVKLTSWMVRVSEIQKTMKCGRLLRFSHFLPESN